MDNPEDKIGFFIHQPQRLDVIYYKGIFCQFLKELPKYRSTIMPISHCNIHSRKKRFQRVLFLKYDAALNSCGKSTPTDKAWTQTNFYDGAQKK